MEASLCNRALNHHNLRRRDGAEKAKIIASGSLRRSGRPANSLNRRGLMVGSRKPMNGLVRRVRTLQKLVPNGKSMGLDGLFCETADYIASLQMQVKVMKSMIELLSGSN